MVAEGALLAEGALVAEGAQVAEGGDFIRDPGDNFSTWEATFLNFLSVKNRQASFFFNYSIPISFHSVDSVGKRCSQRGKYAIPQNTKSVKQLSRISSTVPTLYCPSRMPLYLRYIRCTACCGRVILIGEKGKLLTLRTSHNSLG